MKIPAWSYSSLVDFEGCPKRYKLIRIDKVVPFKETEAIRHGNEVHKALELRLKDKTPLPAKYAQYESMVAKLDKPGVFVEAEYALTRNLEPCGWWDKSCWVRGKVDAGVKAKDKVLIVDWKSGKMKPESSQLELFAALVMTKDKTVNEVNSRFAWLPDNKTTGEKYYRDDVPKIWEHFMQRVARLENAYENDKWIPRPSGLCKPNRSGSYGGCPVGKKHCDFCGS